MPTSQATKLSLRLREMAKLQRAMSCSLLIFCLAVICWYEENRIDGKELFVLRLTPELRHDILSYLVSRPIRKRSTHPRIALHTNFKGLASPAAGVGM
ncbi:hypothetical protein XH94_30415 [Bradyrhizobium zhanjiangense]|uniref:Uncharacterized protein n=1 Tax=Bradyrhizobium zhanjiangense TaxID=1325107 RepID=A0A4Q0SAJ4_9BRAD|nr:hypothetical protein XH94_30415 [Bradyrhizobium zhanjiangense]